jgi:hypothetical protein
MKKDGQVDGVKSLKASADGDNIVLVLPIKNLVWACQHNPEFPLKVLDTKSFATYIAEQLIEFDEDESGATAFMRLLDQLFIAAYEDGQPLEEIPIE